LQIDALGPHANTPNCRAAAFGVRQLAGAFARGTVQCEAAWLALADKSGDKSPQMFSVLQWVFS